MGRVFRIIGLLSWLTIVVVFLTGCPPVTQGETYLLPTFTDGPYIVDHPGHWGTKDNFAPFEDAYIEFKLNISSEPGYTDITVKADLYRAKSNDSYIRRSEVKNVPVPTEGFSDKTIGIIFYDVFDNADLAGGAYELELLIIRGASNGAVVPPNDLILTTYRLSVIRSNDPGTAPQLTILSPTDSSLYPFGTSTYVNGILLSASPSNRNVAWSDEDLATNDVVSIRTSNVPFFYDPSGDDGWIFQRRVGAHKIIVEDAQGTGVNLLEANERIICMQVPWDVDLDLMSDKTELDWNNDVYIPSLTTGEPDLPDDIFTFPAGGYGAGTPLSGGTGCLLNGLNMPDTGLGFLRYLQWDESKDSFDWGTAETIIIMEEAAMLWECWRGDWDNNSDIMYGQMSQLGGGVNTGHTNHHKGLEFDMRYERDDGSDDPLNIKDNPELYDRLGTINFVRLVRKSAQRIGMDVSVIITAELDGAISYSGIDTVTDFVSAGIVIQKRSDHNNHLHIRLTDTYGKPRTDCP